jgi:hypothetical protein
MPKTLALRAVQRHTAASRLARPSRREQHGVFGGLPSWTLIKPNTSAHTPSLIVSLGHVGYFVEGGCEWWCLWPFGGGGGHGT